MSTIGIPTSSGVSIENKNYIEYFNKKLGHIPNIYAAMMHSENAFITYYAFHSRRTSLSIKEWEAISLVVSQVNKSLYGLSEHTMIGMLNGFNETEIMQLRSGVADFDRKLNSLVQLVKNMMEQKGKVDTSLMDNFLSEGYTPEHLVDVLLVVGDNFITNFTGKVLDVPIDSPLAKELQNENK